MKHGETGVTEQSSKGREGGSARKGERTDRQSMGREAVRPGPDLEQAGPGHEPEPCPSLWALSRERRPTREAIPRCPGGRAQRSEVMEQSWVRHAARGGL